MKHVFLKGLKVLTNIFLYSNFPDLSIPQNPNDIKTIVSCISICKQDWGREQQLHKTASSLQNTKPPLETFKVSSRTFSSLPITASNDCTAFCQMKEKQSTQGTF